MPDLWMDVDLALLEVPVNILPLIDDSDFKTIEAAVAFNAAGMDLGWNFVNTFGTFSRTPVTPTSGGTYDWNGQGDGMYTIEIPASGGASINNDTEGFGWFSGVADGILPWRGPIIGFRSVAINDSLIDGVDFLQVDVAQYAGQTVVTPNVTGVPTVDVTHWNDAAVATPSVNGVPEVDVTHWNGTAVAAPHTAGYPVVTVKDGTGTGEIDTTSGGVLVAAIANNAITAAAIATGAIDADAIADNAIDAGAIAADAITEIQSGLSTLTAGQVNAEVLDVLNVDTFAEPGQEAPPATTTLVKKIGYLYKFLRNRKTQTSTTLSIYADDATTVDQKATISDNGTTYDHGEVATGP